MRGCGLSRIQMWNVGISVSSWESFALCYLYVFTYSGGLRTQFHTFSSVHGDAGVQQILRRESEIVGGSPKKPPNKFTPD